jgi:hypothetical protein
VTTDTFNNLVAELAETWEITDDAVAAKAMDAIAGKAVYAAFSPEQFSYAFDLSLQVAMGVTSPMLAIAADGAIPP